LQGRRTAVTGSHQGFSKITQKKAGYFGKRNIHSFGTKLRRGGGSVTPQSGTPERIVSYVVRARETLPNTARRRKSSPVGFRESRREIALVLDLMAITDIRG